MKDDLSTRPGTRSRPALLGVFLAFTINSSVQAADVSLVPTSPVSGLEAGELVSFDVVVDFTTDDNGLGSDFTLGGGFDISFDASHLQFVGINSTSLGDPAFERDPDVFPNLLQSRAFGDFSGLSGPALVGSVTFRVVGIGPAMSSVATGSTNGVGGPFVSAVDFTTLLSVDFDAVEVTSVPEPSTERLMVAGLASLALLYRRRSQSDSPSSGSQ